MVFRGKGMPQDGVDRHVWPGRLPRLSSKPMGLALLVLLALAIFVTLTYNSLARLRLLASNAWADIDVQLKRRHDLIPLLVASVKGHAGYEKGTLEAVVEA